MKQKLVKIAMPLLEVIHKQWFLFGIVVVIIGAYLDPEIGMKGGKSYTKTANSKQSRLSHDFIEHLFSF